MSNKNEDNKIISTTIQEKWQNIVDIIAEITGSSDALITRLDYPDLEVFKASNNKENSFKEGMRSKLSGHYCETVIQSHQKLMVANASQNCKWKNSIGDQAGFKAYLGYPLKWPDGEIFGTLCIHYRKEHDFSNLTKKIMSQFKDLIDFHLQIIDDNNIMQINNKKLEQQKIELSASFEQLTAYNQEVIAMNQELEQSFQEVNKLNRRFVNMIELVSDIEDKTLLSENEFFSDLLKHAVEIIPEADFGKICLINDRNKCVFIDAVGHDIKILKNIEIDSTDLFYNTNTGINITSGCFFNLDKLSLENKEMFLKALKPIKDSLYINIMVDGELAARMSLEIKEKSSKSFSETTKKILESFSTLASAFFAFKRFDKLQTNFTKELTTSVIKIMEMYDLYTKGHSESVAELASVIAKEMNLSRKTIKNTYWAGLVHDIGKLLIPIEIINKAEKLTENELELIKKHPVWGNKALSDSKTLQPIAKYLLYHHERWDGKGYPEGLKGDQIPLISQILGVADAWDAMSSKRSYRDPLSFEKAFAEIKDNKGTQFSPIVVEAFIKIADDDRIEDLKKDVLKSEINNMKITDINIFEKEDSYKKLAESVKAILWEYDIKTDNWDYVSPQSETILGYAAEEWTGLDFWTEHLHPDDKDSARNYCLECTAQGEDHVFEYRFRKFNGQYLWIRDEVTVVMSENEAVKIRGFMIDITKFKIMENKIRKLSYRDHLTGLYNRRYLDYQLDRLRDSNSYPVSFITADIDQLKKINDKYGHSRGDYYIKKAADVFRNVLRTADIIARTGGDEFAVLLPKTTYKTTKNICDRIQEKLRDINNKDMLPEILSISLGYSTALNKWDDLNRIYEKSDQAMYEIKGIK